MTTSWHNVAPESSITGEKGKEFLVAGVVLAIFRKGDDVFAIDGMCAHQGGPIAQGELNGNCVTCPWHGWQYDIATGCNQITKRKMLQVYATRIVDGELQVELPDESDIPQ